MDTTAETCIKCWDLIHAIDLCFGIAQLSPTPAHIAYSTEPFKFKSHLSGLTTVSKYILHRQKILLSILKSYFPCHKTSLKKLPISFLFPITCSTFLPLKTSCLLPSAASMQRTLGFCSYFNKYLNCWHEIEECASKRGFLLWSMTHNSAEIKLFLQKLQVLLERGLQEIPCYIRQYNTGHIVSPDNCWEDTNED